MRYCRCDEKTIEVDSEEFRKDPSKYLSQVKDNTAVRVVVKESGLRIAVMTVAAPAALHCPKCHMGIDD
jgi:hypothetical protein